MSYVDCEQSLSFPSVFLAFLSGKQLAARSAGAEEKENSGNHTEL